MARSDVDQVVQLPVQLERAPLRPGWIELRLDGMTGPLKSDARLSLLAPGRNGRAVDYVLARFAGTHDSLVLHSDMAVAGATLTCSAASLAIAGAAMVRVTRIGLIRRAWQRDRKGAASAAYWRLRGKKLRARNILLRILGNPRRMAYADWLARQQETWAADIDTLRRAAASSTDRPRIGVLILGRPDQPTATQTLAGLARQHIQPEQIVTAGPGTDWLAQASGMTSCDWLVLLPDGHVLAPDALLRITAAAGAAPTPAAVYWDSDAIAPDGRRCEPEFKPRWNEALYLARDYIGAFAVARTAVRNAGSARLQLPEALADCYLLHAAQSGAGPIVHLPYVLSHRLASGSRATGTDGSGEARRALVEAFARAETAGATATAQSDGTLRLTYPTPEPKPRVSLIVPTRDRLDLLEACIAGLRQRTAYPNLEILIADNASTQPATLDYFATVTRDPRVRVIACPGPFNFSAINNRAAAQAQGDVLGFINNDIEVIKTDWLEEMVGHALRPGIGAVGARLLYASGRVQHAGIILGIGGLAGHAHRFAETSDGGYLGRLQAQQYFAAVTAACLLVERGKFLAVGGFDADAFPVAYNDVDLCLRLRAAGFETLFTPYAELFHKESASRIKDTTPQRRAAYDQECRRFVERWGDLIANDPYYHPALTRTMENFSLD